MKSLIMLLAVAVLITACGTKYETPTAGDAKKETSGMVEDAKKEADKAAADAKEEADKAAEEAKKETADALKKVGG